MMDLQKVALIAAQECERQGVGLDGLVSLVSSFQWARELSRLGKLPCRDSVLILAKLIEPSNKGMYRSTPVTFANGESSCDAREVNSALRRHWHFLDTLSSKDVDSWIKHFLWIHPFTDGNGRIAWVLRTWLLNQWDSPENLPDYKW